ncbi:hypothetical protein [Mixta gaviniae]|uniref:Uncharacterized protein n=1 Tax=Mixta gaviniae TaxID=665914 RepID=A0A1X1EEW0_9GAMM|nr:hypothetical protein [Mixta gaviniae]AUX94268.1 hypothetical protein C2E15_15090 [Mixta gaviniae]ORM87353.1 hypothetical protein HA44_01495 [Mixta gaviniae]
MSGFKGTEGRWAVVDGLSAGKQVISESAPKVRRNIASCGGPKREHNAALIAAAPELLEALLLFTSKTEQGFVMNQSDIDKCKAAIAKALGNH